MASFHHKRQEHTVRPEAASHGGRAVGVQLAMAATNVCRRGREDRPARAGTVLAGPEGRNTAAYNLDYERSRPEHTQLKRGTSKTRTAPAIPNQSRYYAREPRQANKLKTERKKRNTTLVRVWRRPTKDTRRNIREWRGCARRCGPGGSLAVT